MLILIFLIPLLFNLTAISAETITLADLPAEQYSVRSPKNSTTDEIIVVSDTPQMYDAHICALLTFSLIVGINYKLVGMFNRNFATKLQEARTKIGFFVASYFYEKVFLVF